MQKEKNSQRPTTWAAICLIKIGRNLGKLYIKTKEIFRSIRIMWMGMGQKHAHTSSVQVLSANHVKSLKSSVNIAKSGKLQFAPLKFMQL